MPKPLATPNGSAAPTATATAPSSQPHSLVLDLHVRNHPGTMSHITGLFARRAFNLEAILCVPNADAETSRMLLLVAAEPRVSQLQHQLAKLYDVIEVRVRRDLDPAVFQAMSVLTR